MPSAANPQAHRSPSHCTPPFSPEPAPGSRRRITPQARLNKAPPASSMADPVTRECQGPPANPDVPGVGKTTQATRGPTGPNLDSPQANDLPLMLPQGPITAHKGPRGHQEFGAGAWQTRSHWGAPPASWAVMRTQHRCMVQRGSRATSFRRSGPPPTAVGDPSTGSAVHRANSAVGRPQGRTRPTKNWGISSLFGSVSIQGMNTFQAFPLSMWCLVRPRLGSTW